MYISSRVYFDTFRFLSIFLICLCSVLNKFGQWMSKQMVSFVIGKHFLPQESALWLWRLNPALIFQDVFIFCFVFFLQFVGDVCSLSSRILNIKSIQMEILKRWRNLISSYVIGSSQTARKKVTDITWKSG